MRLMFVGILLAAAAASAQTPPPAPAPVSAPVSAPMSAPAAAPGTMPGVDFDVILPALAHEACSREQTCGCSKGVEACVKMLVEADLPTATMACLAFQPCETYCESEEAGMPGTKLHAACLTPEAQAAAKTRFKESSVRATCTQVKECGCEERSVDQCTSDLLVSLNNVPGQYFACINHQPCSELCSQKSVEPGGVIHTRCMAPALAAHKAREKKTAGSLLMEMHRMQRMHELNMRIIRSMGGSGTRYRVYDSRGNYLRDE